MKGYDLDSLVIGVGDLQIYVRRGYWEKTLLLYRITAGEE